MDNDKQAPKTTDPNRKAKTVIAGDVEIVGSIKCTTDIRIDGKLNGDLNCAASATVGESAVVKGNLSVDSVSVHGQINGNMTAKDRIEMKSTARVTGDIRAMRLTVEDGVTFVGKSEVNPSGHPSGRPAADQKPSSSSSDAAKSDEKGDEEKGKSSMFSKK